MSNVRNDGGAAVVRWLKAAGVPRIFSVSGGPLNPIYHAAARLDLPLVHTRHEAAACFMAEASARVTGMPAAAALTLGPGVTNGITPALVAAMAGTPLLILGAQAPIATFEKGAGMSWDPLPIVGSLMKWAARVHDPDRIGEYLDIAWRKMWAGRPGPVFLEVPANVLAGAVESGEAPPPAAPVRPGLADADLERVRAALAAAERPVLILGDELHWTPAEGLTDAVAEAGLPFATMRLARGVIDERHPLWLGPAYVPCNATLRRALAETDCVVLLGHHFEFDLGFGAGVSDDATVVQVASDPDLLNRNRRARVALAASPAGVAPAIASARPAIDHGWRDRLLGEWAEERRAQTEGAGGNVLHPAAVADAVAEAAPDNAIFVTSHGNVDFWVDARLRLSRPGRYLRAGQSGALGAELPYAVGARFADPDAPVFVFVGDGGVGYHVTELDTAGRYGRPVVVLVLDDERWGAIGLPQETAYGEMYEMHLPRRDWVRVAEGLGGGGTLARTPEAVRTAVAAALTDDRPHLIQVPVASIISPYMDYISR